MSNLYCGKLYFCTLGRHQSHTFSCMHFCWQATVIYNESKGHVSSAFWKDTLNMASVLALQEHYSRSFLIQIKSSLGLVPKPGLLSWFERLWSKPQNVQGAPNTALHPSIFLLLISSNVACSFVFYLATVHWEDDNSHLRMWRISMFTLQLAVWNMPHSINMMEQNSVTQDFDSNHLNSCKPTYMCIKYPCRPSVLWSFPVYTF